MYRNNVNQFPAHVSRTTTAATGEQGGPATTGDARSAGGPVQRDSFIPVQARRAQPGQGRPQAPRTALPGRSSGFPGTAAPSMLPQDTAFFQPFEQQPFDTFGLAGQPQGSFHGSSMAPGHRAAAPLRDFYSLDRFVPSMPESQAAFFQPGFDQVAFPLPDAGPGPHGYAGFEPQAHAGMQAVPQQAAPQEIDDLQAVFASLTEADHAAINEIVVAEAQRLFGEPQPSAQHGPQARAHRASPQAADLPGTFGSYLYPGHANPPRPEAVSRGLLDAIDTPMNEWGRDAVSAALDRGVPHYEIACELRVPENMIDDFARQYQEAKQRLSGA